MKIDSSKLRQLMNEIVKDSFGADTFDRRRLMELTELKVRELGFWDREDDHLSGSSNPKSVGLANIDYRVSVMARFGEIVNVGRGRWRLRTLKS